MKKQIVKHCKKFKSWKVVNYQKAKDHQVLGCQWVFKYKTNKHNRVQKCKTRLVVCRNQQKQHELPTRATTLAIMFLHILLAMVAKFDLKTIQFNAVNAFVYADLDKTIYMQFLSEYGKDPENEKKRKIHDN